MSSQSSTSRTASAVRPGEWEEWVRIYNMYHSSPEEKEAAILETIDRLKFVIQKKVSAGAAHTRANGLRDPEDLSQNLMLAVIDCLETYNPYFNGQRITFLTYYETTAMHQYSGWSRGADYFGNGAEVTQYELGKGRKRTFFSLEEDIRNPESATAKHYDKNTSASAESVYFSKYISPEFRDLYEETLNAPPEERRRKFTALMKLQELDI